MTYGKACLATGCAAGLYRLGSCRSGACRQIFEAMPCYYITAQQCLLELRQRTQQRASDYRREETAQQQLTEPSASAPSVSVRSTKLPVLLCPIIQKQLVLAPTVLPIGTRRSCSEQSDVVWTVSLPMKLHFHLPWQVSSCLSACPARAGPAVCHCEVGPLSPFQ